MNNINSLIKRFFLALFLINTLISGCSANSTKSRTPALFNTKAEAEEAAEDFNCTGAHQMGDKWMPCTMHGMHKQHKHN